MAVVPFRFPENKRTAGRDIRAHREWIQRGLDDGVVLLGGSIRLGLGGEALAHSRSLPELEMWEDDDPLVDGSIDSAESIAIAPSMADRPLSVLL